MMIKRGTAILLALCLLPALALADSLATVTAQPDRRAADRAVVKTMEQDGTSPMYEAPDEGSAVLMTYYSGAPLQVLRQAGAGFYQVQAGEPDAGLMGYMRARDVEVGEAAERVVIPACMELRFNQETPVYAYCDEGAKVIGSCEPGKTYYAMSKNDEKWVQLYLPPMEHIWEQEGRITRGFVKLETGLAIGQWRVMWIRTVEPRVGEITREQAAALAVEYLTQTKDLGLPEIYTQRKALETMQSRAQLLQTEQLMINDWWVYFWEREGSDVVGVYVYADAQGNVKMHHRYCPAGEYPYGVTPTL